MRALSLVACAAFAAVAACGQVAGDGAEAGAGAGGGDAGVAACGFDPAFAAGDASAAMGQCSAARAVVVCVTPSGGGESCISDDPTSCPDPSLAGGMAGGGISCSNRCSASEYGVACSADATPAGCRNVLGPAPGGGETWSCCPCVR